MLRETGRVVAVEADAVWVETIRSSQCGRCAARSGCGHGVLSRGAGQSRGLIRARGGQRLRSDACELDDTVEIELPESAVLLASITVYGVPLGVATLLALLLGSWGEAAAASGFLLGLLGAFVGVRYGLERWAPGDRFEPRLYAIRQPSDAGLIARQSAT